MIVKLLNWTPHPLKTVLFAYNMMKEKKIETDIPSLNLKDARWFTKQIIADSLNTPLEYVSTIWFFDKVTRAFQQQLTRHRIFGFSIQSMRVVDKDNFAEKKQYLLPDDLDGSKRIALYEYSMEKIETLYNRMLKYGTPIQVARGILPLNIFSPISMVANMKGLLGMFEQRMCRQVQGEFKEVVKKMIKEIKDKMSPVFVEHLKEPCKMTGRCMMSAENELRLAGHDTLNREVCPLYKSVRKGG